MCCAGPGMEDWIPWPEMDQDKLQKKKKEVSVLEGKKIIKSQVFKRP